ncbi:hypothetical protein MMPV_004922 [Pyropia vietnamensis]
MGSTRSGATRGGGGGGGDGGSARGGDCVWNTAGLSEAAAAAGDLLAMTNGAYRAAVAARPPPGGWKLAGFDLDHTLIAPSSAKARFFGPTETTWVPALPSVLPGLAATAAAGYLIVVLTNQGGLNKQPRLLSTLRGRVESFAAALEPAVPLVVYIAPGYNRLRKPAVGLWEAAVAGFVSAAPPPGVSFNDAVNKAASVYVGDAAGRPRDFADTDRKLALNVGIRFFTPEAFFGSPVVKSNGLWRQTNQLPTVVEEDLSRHPLSGYDPAVDLPSAIVCDRASCEAEAVAAAVTPPDFLDAVPPGCGGGGRGRGANPPQTVVLLVGCPGSGKSTFAERHLTLARGYVRVSTDDVGTVPRAVKAVREALLDGRSVVVDNTHGGVAARKVFLDAARRATPGVVIKALVFDTPRETAMHLNLLREGCLVPSPPGGTAASGGAPAAVAVMPYGYFGGRRRVPAVSYNVFAARFVEPSTDEGFHAIGHVRFVPQFRSNSERMVFAQRT